MMQIAKKQADFLASPEGIAARNTLIKMVSDDTYNTGSSYSSNTSMYSDNKIPFVDKHMNYLMTHPGIDPAQYLANLRLISRIR